MRRELGIYDPEIIKAFKNKTYYFFKKNNIGFKDNDKEKEISNIFGENLDFNEIKVQKYDLHRFSVNDIRKNISQRFAFKNKKYALWILYNIYNNENEHSRDKAESPKVFYYDEGDDLHMLSATKEILSVIDVKDVYFFDRNKDLESFSIYIPIYNLNETEDFHLNKVSNVISKYDKLGIFDNESGITSPEIIYLLENGTLAEYNLQLERYRSLKNKYIIDLSVQKEFEKYEFSVNLWVGETIQKNSNNEIALTFSFKENYCSFFVQDMIMDESENSEKSKRKAGEIMKWLEIKENDEFSWNEADVIIHKFAKKYIK